MHFLSQLWLPMVVASVACFIASALIWMVGKYHNGEWKEVPNVSGLRDLLRAAAVQPGGYMFPYMSDADRKDKTRAAAKMKEWAEGPSGVVYVMPAGTMNMGKMMGQQFVFFLLVNLCIGLLLNRAWVPTGEYQRHVAKMAFAIAFIAFEFASVPETIWFGRPLKSLILQGIDALIYAGVTGLVWALLWPK
jgi:hypothetical protein